MDVRSKRNVHTSSVGANFDVICNRVRRRNDFVSRAEIFRQQFVRSSFLFSFSSRDSSELQTSHDVLKSAMRWFRAGFQHLFVRIPDDFGKTEICNANGCRSKLVEKFIIIIAVVIC